MWQTLIGIGLAISAAWGALLVALVLVRPKGSLLGEAVRILPDTLGLLRRIALDRTLPRGARARLWLSLVYLALPIDLIPDFIPVIGYADDAIVICWALRSVVRSAGRAAVLRHWRGTAQGLAALGRIAGISGLDYGTSTTT